MNADERRRRSAAVQGVRAGIISRLTADVIDLGIVILLTFLALVGYAAARYLLGAGSFTMPRAGWRNTSIVFPIVAFLYLTAAWSAKGRSVGKSLLGLRVVRYDNTPLHIPRAAGRALWCMVLPLISLGWVAVSQKSAGLHDLALGTIVIHDWSTGTHSG